MGGACLNCGAALHGPWCHACGQPVEAGAGAARQRWAHQWGRIRHSLVSLMVRPGLLTVEFCQGQRIRAIAPWRLAFNAITVFFLISVLTDFNVTKLTERDTTGRSAAAIGEIAARTGLPKQTVLDRVERRFSTVYTCMLSLSVAGYALMAWLLHWRQRRPWRVHGVFALHFVAFVFGVSIVYFGGLALVGQVATREVMDGIRHAGTVGLALWLALYVGLGYRRVYGDGPWLAAGKAVVTALAGTVVDGLIFAGALALTFRSF